MINQTKAYEDLIKSAMNVRVMATLKLNVQLLKRRELNALAAKGMDIQKKIV